MVKYDKKIVQLVALLIATVVVVHHFIIVDRFAVNIPWRDDYQDIFVFLLSVDGGVSWPGYLEALFKPHSDHITSASRLIYQCVTWAVGEMEFAILSMVANSVLLLLLIAFIFAIPLELRSPYVILWLVLLLMSPVYSKTIIWTMTSFAFFCVHLYVLLTIILLRSINVKRFVAAVLCASLATLTMSNGLLIWFVGAVAIFMAYRQDRGILRLLYIWIVIAALVVVGLHVLSDNTISAREIVNQVVSRPIYVMRFGVAMLGSAVAFNDVILAQFLGLIGVFIFVWVSYRGAKNQFTVFHYYLWFVALEILLVTAARAYGYQYFGGLPMALLPRYTFMSLQFWMALFVIGVVQNYTFSLRGNLVIGSFCAAFYIFSLIVYLPIIESFSKKRQVEYEVKGIYMPGYVSEDDLEDSINRAVSRGLYVPPDHH